LDTWLGVTDGTLKKISNSNKDVLALCLEILDLNVIDWLLLNLGLLFLNELAFNRFWLSNGDIVDIDNTTGD
jgi:hypothetical protein